MMRARFRIVQDQYDNKYIVEWWRWYWPFWCEPITNAHSSIERAREYARLYLPKRVVEYLGTLSSAEGAA